ncbi:uncharacterized protein KIAA1614 homolog [Pelodytes ibericus]
MAAEVNTRESVPHKDNEKRRTSRGSKAPRKSKTVSGKCEGAEHVRTLVEPVTHTKTSAFQGKVKALKEKQRELRPSACSREEGSLIEDALVNPQLRTYLTEEALESSSPGRYPDNSQQTPVPEDFSEVYTRDNTTGHNYSEHLANNLSAFSPHMNAIGSRLWPQDQVDDSSQDQLGSSQFARNLSLAERVERNRQELKSKFNSITWYHDDHLHGDAEEQIHASKDGSWIYLGDMDDDSGVSLPVSESCRDLSVRHEQAKQLLHRARMKAKGASPLRASHCVIPHPHSQPPLRRSPCVSGGLTDGGSLSDSSSSDYCSHHRGSRGGSPSHVRFQDESEREAEDRYRERQQQGPQTQCMNTTLPGKRHSNVSWAQCHLMPSRNDHCGACDSYINGSGGASQGTSPRNAQLGSRISQEGPLSFPVGARPSPHWILPSQPWRIHSELIRETHIGGDSTADDSGEEEGSHSQSKNTPSCSVRRNSGNKPTDSFPRHEKFTYPSDHGTETSGNVSGLKFVNETQISQRKPALEPSEKPNSPLVKPLPRTDISQSNLGTQAVTRAAIKPKTQKSGMTSLESKKELQVLSTDIEIGTNLLNTEARKGTNKLTSADRRTQTAHIIHNQMSPVEADNLSISGHVPVPPAGRAPTSGPSRSNRFTIRSEGTIAQLSIQSPPEGCMVQINDKKNVQCNPLPKSKQNNQEALEDNQQVSQPGIKAKEHRTRERSHRSRKPSDNVKGHKIQDRLQVPGEQRERERFHITKRESDRERPDFTGEQGNASDQVNRTMSNSSRDQIISKKHHATREERNTETSRTDRQQYCVNNAEKADNLCQPTKQDYANQDKHVAQEPVDERNVTATPHCPLQPSGKKGDIRSGMRKIFSTFGLSSRPRLDRFQSSSLEQISHAAANDRDASRDGDSELYSRAVKPSAIKKSPSLQSLKLMSPFHLPRKSSSVQNLFGKSDRSVVYVTGDGSTAPRRALSVEDIGSPDKARAVGRVAEIYPDGTRLLELQRPPQGSFGFTISSGNGRPDSGVYVQEMIDDNAAKLYSGLLRVGDEILELNGTKVSTLRHAQLNEMMTREPTLSLRVLHQRRTKC